MSRGCAVSAHMLAVLGEIDGLLCSCVSPPHHSQILAPEAAAGAYAQGHLYYSIT